MLKRSLLTGLAITLLVVQACGSDDGKKRARSAADGGAAGEAGGPDQGQDAAGAAGKPPVNEGGTGGTGEVVTVGGTGGTEDPPVTVAGAGAGGEPPLPPAPELLFSVKYGAHGLADTAISQQASPENFIYTTNTGSQDAVDGTNAVKVTGAALGLAETDSVIAFAEEQAEPKSPMYLFTLADGSEGASGTRSYQSYNNDNTEEGNLYYSDGIGLYDGGEGTNYMGYNGLTASQVSLGLSTGMNIDANPDDLRGLAVHDANKELKELYFTVNSAAVGLADSGVDTVDSDHQGCTLFKSELDGTNSVAFTCEQLGLTPTDQIDALAIFEGATGPTVIFSVSSASQGAVGSAVATILAETSTVGATLFKSIGDGTNTVHLPGRGLGLDEYEYPFDDLDGVAIIDQPKVTGSAPASCELTYDPYDAVNGGGLGSIESTVSVGNNVMVLFGPIAQAGAGARLLAYNATTCQFLQQVDLPQEFEDASGLAIVPQAGWLPSKPLDKVEFFRARVVTYDLELRRYDAAGALLKQYPISNSAYAYPLGLFYAAGQFALVTNYGRSSFPVPETDTAGIDAPVYRLTWPCADQGNVGGVDNDGNLYLARSQEVSSDFRVCGFRPDAEMLPAPYAWTSAVDGYVGGFIAPGGSHFLLHSGEPMSIERSDFPKL